MLLSLCYLKFKHYDKKFFFLPSIPVQNHGIFCFFLLISGHVFFFRVLGFIFEGRRGSTFLFTFSFAFSGFLKCPSFVELEKQKQKQKYMSPQSTASSVLVILSLNWINFNSVAFCFMLFYLRTIFDLWMTIWEFFVGVIPTFLISQLLLGFHDWLEHTLK